MLMNSDEKPNGANKGNFWTTVPGILTGLTGLIVAVTGLITALNQTGVLNLTSSSPPTPSPSVSPSPSLSPSPISSPTPSAAIPVSPPNSHDDPSQQPFVILLGSDTTLDSAIYEANRVGEVARRMDLSVDRFKKGNFYVTTLGFFSTQEEANSFRNIIIKEIPYYQSTSPQIQNLQEWCPSFTQVGKSYLECRN